MANIIEIFNNKIDESKIVGDNKFFNKSEELTEFNKLQQKYISSVDYSNPSNFARFGSAEEYYKNAINYINSEFPYDSCTTDKLKWINSLNEFEYYIYNTEYPRAVGYVQLEDTQYITIYSPFKLNLESSKDTYNNKVNLSLNKILDFDNGITFESWLKFDSSETKIFEVTAYSGSGTSYTQTQFCNISKDNSGLLSVDGYAFNTVFSPDTWYHISIVVKSEFSLLYINGILEERLNFLSPLPASQNKYHFSELGLFYNSNNITNFTKSNVFSVGGIGSLYIDECRLWNYARSTEDIGRYWFTNIDGNDFTDPFNSELLFYYKFNEGWDSQYGFLCLDYSGYQNDAEIVDYNAACRVIGSAFDLSGIVQDREKGDIILKGLTYSIVVKEFYNNKILLGKEYDYFNIHSLYNKFPGWVLQEEEQKNIKHLKQIIQIISSYFDDLYNKIKESSEYKTIKYNVDKDKLYPFYDKILTSTGFDVTDLFSNLDTVEKISSRNDTTLFDEDIQKTKNSIFQNIYNNLSYILKSKGTEKSIKSFLKSYGVNDQLVRINLYSDGSEYNISNRLKETVVRKKIIYLNNDKSIYQEYNTPGFLESGSLDYYTLETCLKPVQSNVVTCSLFGLTCNPDANTTSISGSNYSYHVSIENDSVYGSRFILQNSSSVIASSSYYQDLYDGTVWNLGLRKKPTVDTVKGAENIQYNIELYGTNTNSAFQKSFQLNGPLEGTAGYIKYYIGARKQHLDSANIINLTDSEFLYCNFWGDYLNNEAIISHNKEILSYGVDE